MRTYFYILRDLAVFALCALSLVASLLLAASYGG